MINNETLQHVTKSTQQRLPTQSGNNTTATTYGVLPV